MTIELSCCKFPSRKVLLKEWENNRESIMSFVEQVHLGVKGFVFDAFGSPVKDPTVHFRHADTQTPAGKNIKGTKRGEYWKLLIPDRRYEAKAFKKSRDGQIYESEWIPFTTRKQVLQVNLSLNVNPK